MKYTPRRFDSQNFLPGSVTQGKASKKLFVTSSSDPAKTNDTGEGYAAGTTWVNTTSGQIFLCTDSTAENSVWRGQEGDDINYVQHSTGDTNYYFTGPGPASGMTGTGSVIKVQFSNDADSDTGYDMGFPGGSAGSYDGVGHGSTTHMFQSGGNIHPSPGLQDTVQKMTYASLADSADHGELSATIRAHSGLSSTTEGFCVGGQPGWADKIDRFSFATPFSTTADVGEMNEIVHSMAGISGTIQGKGWLCGGHEDNTMVNTIQTLSFDAGENNTADWGELSATSGNNIGHNDQTYGWVERASTGPGNQTNQTNNRDYFSLASAGNGSDSGEAVTTTYDRSQPGGMSPTHGYSALGYNPGAGSDPVGLDAIEKFAYASPYNGSDVGEAPAHGYAGMGASD